MSVQRRPAVPGRGRTPARRRRMLLQRAPRSLRGRRRRRRARRHEAGRDVGARNQQRAPRETLAQFIDTVVRRSAEAPGSGSVASRTSGSTCTTDRCRETFLAHRAGRPPAQPRAGSGRHTMRTRFESGPPGGGRRRLGRKFGGPSCSRSCWGSTSQSRNT